MRVVLRRCAWVAIAVGVAVLSWALLPGYTDTVPMLASTINAQGQSPIPAGASTFSCPALREDEAEYFFAERYPERRPCEEGRSARKESAKASLALVVLTASVLVGEFVTRQSPEAKPAAEEEVPSTAP